MERESRPAAWLQAVGNAYAAILFGGDPRWGAVLAATTLLRPASGLGGLLAVLSGTLTARALGYRPDSILLGVYGYNALLVGLSVLAGRGLDGTTATLVVLAGSASALLTAVLGDALRRGMNLPVLVLPFTILGTLLGPALESIGPAPGTAWVEAGAWFALPALPEAADRLLCGFGALFFQPGPEAGLVVLVAALAVSRIGTVAMVAGMAVAGAMTDLLHAGTDPATALAARYNGGLAGAAVGAYLFVPGRAAAAAGVGAAALAAWLTVALAALLGKLGLPVLAWPFVLVTLVMMRALELRAPDRPPFFPVLPGASPEVNFDWTATLAARFGIPGPPRFVLPVAGTWTVSQGVDGDHTHRGAWAHAWDLEVTDERGFPFRGDGARLEDYLCFGRPVLAAGAGTVESVVDGRPDISPGGMDTALPWGNAVVIRHGPELFTVLAHLQSGSITVKPGQTVAAGEPVAACGSSGRSPRPHLHLQAQRTPELGAAAIPCRLVHYLAERRDGSRQYFALGVPVVGEQVSRPAPDPVVESFGVLPVGSEIELEVEAGGDPGRPAGVRGNARSGVAYHLGVAVRSGSCRDDGSSAIRTAGTDFATDATGGAADARGGNRGMTQRVRLVSEVTLLGERFLRDGESGGRLYFTHAHGDLAFTSLADRSGGALWALFLALPRLPWAGAGAQAWSDRPPAAALLSPAWAFAHDLVRSLADPLEIRSESTVRENGELRVVETRTGFGWGWGFAWRYRARVEIDREGLSALSVTDLRRGAPVFAARRHVRVCEPAVEPCAAGR